MSRTRNAIPIAIIRSRDDRGRMTIDAYGEPDPDAGIDAVIALLRAAADLYGDGKLTTAACDSASSLLTGAAAYRQQQELNDRQ